MKCINCGHELDPNAEYCENCGMLVGIDDDGSQKETHTDSEFVVNIPENFTVNEDDSQSVEKYNDTQAGDFAADETQPQSVTESEQEPLEVPAVEIEPEVEQPSQSDANDKDEPFDVGLESEEQNSQSNVGAPESSRKTPADQIEAVKKIKVYSDDYNDTKRSKKGIVTVAVLIIVVAAVAAVGFKMIKRPASKPSETTKPTLAEITSDSGKEKDTSKKDETEETSEKNTSGKETTDSKDKTSNLTTVRPTSGSNGNVGVVTPSSAQQARPSQSAAASSRPTSAGAPSKPSSTAKPSSAAQSTSSSKPSTAASTSRTTTANTKPNTTSPYGFNNVTVQKPASTSSNPYKVYVMESSITMRNKPSIKGERVVYLPIGTPCTVYAKQDGFFYVRSDRYGVYGWVSADYVSKSRPVSDTTTVVPNLVKPDKTYSTPQTKHVTAAEGLRLRKGPGTKYDTILLIDIGFPVKVTGYSSTVSGWVYVTDTTHGVNGWVSAEYIK